MELRTATQEVREASLGWMLKKLAAGLDADMEALLAPLGLDMPSFAILMTVLERHPLSQAGIAERIGIAPYRVSRGLDRLEGLGYVARRPDPGSRRSLVIRPTEDGASLAPRLYGVVETVNARLSAPLSETERAQLTGLLQRMVAARNGR